MKMKITLLPADDPLFTGGVLIPILVPRITPADAKKVNLGGSPEPPTPADVPELVATDRGRDPEEPAI